jgi:hypothetical protein
MAKNEFYEAICIAAIYLLLRRTRVRSVILIITSQSVSKYRSWPKADS